MKQKIHNHFNSYDLMVNKMKMVKVITPVIRLENIQI